MKFVKDEVATIPKEEIDALLNEENDINIVNAAAKEIADQLGIEETKQVEEPKPHTINVTKDAWNEKTVATLVHLRKSPDVNSESLTTIRGGDIIKVSSSFSHPSFEKVKYKNKDGYVKKSFVRDL